MSKLVAGFAFPKVTHLQTGKGSLLWGAQVPAFPQTP